MSQPLRRLLNRAVRTSCEDEGFVAEARRLAAEAPLDALLLCVGNASVDEAQAELLCSLLRLLPEVVAFCATTQGEEALCTCLKDILATPLSLARQRAVLLLLARLSHSSPAAPLASTPDPSPLLARAALLDHVLLPMLRHADVRSCAARGGLPLQAILQLLSARALLPTAEQLPSRRREPPLSAASLGALLSALLALLRLRTQLPHESVKLLLRCAHAAVQLLVPRAAAAAREADSPLAAEERGWRALEWRLQLHTWAVADRMAPRAAAAAPLAVGARFYGWLRAVAPAETARERMASLLLAAAVPALPARQALQLCLAEEPPPSPRDVIAALAVCLPQGVVLEWQHAVSQVLPVLQRHAMLPGSLHVPLPHGEAERSTALRAQCLLRALILHRELTRAEGGGLERGESAEDTAEANARQRACFSAGLATWVHHSAHAATEPLATAHLLGVVLRAAKEVPQDFHDRYAVLCLGLVNQLEEQLRPPDVEESDNSDGQAVDDLAAATYESEGSADSIMPSQAQLSHQKRLHAIQVALFGVLEAANISPLSFSSRLCDMDDTATT
ncbi:hypothetical protein AB1Y20_000509 [Prymnesium parvum]|uniref:Uncharacterized protein n=1 Tax=Prymnesium parvum TaxID=97485 RepID=A0AB34K619_PRYPA